MLISSLRDKKNEKNKHLFIYSAKKKMEKINKNLCDIFMKDISLCRKLRLLVIKRVFSSKMADEFAPREGNLNYE
ncbi:hypothetical protein [Citrobacter youngae]|uniref:hypothetical protein n=1 Tax=Citrobacter youngae TaxID=133448 RepID=UPI0026D618F8